MRELDLASIAAIDQAWKRLELTVTEEAACDCVDIGLDNEPDRSFSGARWGSRLASKARNVSSGCRPGMGTKGDKHCWQVSINPSSRNLAHVRLTHCRSMSSKILDR